MRFFVAVFLLGTMLSLAFPVLGHHAQAPFFHQDRTVEVKGIVKKWHFANPHPVLYVETDENGQKIMWEVQFAPASVLRKRGWDKDTFKVGDAVIASGHPSKAPGTHGMEIGVIKRGDGSPVR